MLAGAPGFEPGNGGIKIRCLTTWLRPNARPDCRRRFAFGRAQHNGAHPCGSMTAQGAVTGLRLSTPAPHPIMSPVIYIMWRRLPPGGPKEDQWPEFCRCHRRRQRPHHPDEPPGKEERADPADVCHDDRGALPRPEPTMRSAASCSPAPPARSPPAPISANFSNRPKTGALRPKTLEFLNALARNEQTAGRRRRRARRRHRHHHAVSLRSCRRLDRREILHAVHQTRAHSRSRIEPAGADAHGLCARLCAAGDGTPDDSRRGERGRPRQHSGRSRRSST